MTAGDDDEPRTERGEIGRIRTQQGRFRSVRREDGRHGEEQLASCRFHLLGNEAFAPTGHQHRVDDGRRESTGGNSLRENADVVSGGKKADLHGVDRDLREDRIELCGEELRARRLDALDRPEALRGDGGDSDHAVDAMRGERRQVGRQTGSSERIMRRDGESDWWLHPAIVPHRGTGPRARETAEVHETTRGKLLVAAPTLLDPNFARTVVFMLEHNDEGAIGVVLNRPSELPVATTIEPWAGRTVPPSVIFLGGPVSPSSVIALASVSLDDAGANWNPILGRIGTVDLDVDPSEVPGLDEVRMFAGYAGWSGGQLEAELHDDCWFEVTAELTDVHTDDPDELWWEVLARQPEPLNRLAHYPRDPSDN